MSTWNHRVFKNEAVDDFEPTYEFVEAHYDDDGTPTGWGEPFMIADNLEGLTELISRLQKALAQPVLTAKDFTN